MVSSVTNTSRNSFEATKAQEEKISKNAQVKKKELDSLSKEAAKPQQKRNASCSTAQILDYIPFVSFFKNGIDLILKLVWRPANPESLSPNSKAYFEHISQKSVFRCVIGMIPVVGNLIAALIDSSRRSSAEKQESPDAREVSSKLPESSSTPSFERTTSTEEETLKNPIRENKDKESSLPSYDNSEEDKTPDFNDNKNSSKKKDKEPSYSGTTPSYSSTRSSSRSSSSKPKDKEPSYISTASSTSSSSRSSSSKPKDKESSSTRSYSSAPNSTEASSSSSSYAGTSSNSYSENAYRKDRSNPSRSSHLGSSSEPSNSESTSSSIPSYSSSGNSAPFVKEDTFSSLWDKYQNGSSKQKEEAIEAACRATLEDSVLKTNEGRKLLQHIFWKGSNTHKKLIVSTISPNIHKWLFLHREEWMKLHYVPDELRDVIVDIFVKNDLSGKEASAYYLFKSVYDDKMKIKIIDAYCKAADAGHNQAVDVLEHFYSNAISTPQREKILGWFFKQAERPSSSHYEKAWDFISSRLGKEYFDDGETFTYDWIAKQLDRQDPAIRNRVWEFIRFSAHFSEKNEINLLEKIGKKILTSTSQGERDKMVSYIKAKYVSGYSSVQTQAFNILREIAESGDLDMMFFIANDYYFQKNDEILARYWYQKAADKGHLDSIYEIGASYYRKNSTDTSISYFTKAADRGHIKSIHFLADIYESRLEFGDAIKWLEKAAALGDRSAREKIDELKDRAAQKKKWEDDLNDLDEKSKKFERDYKEYQRQYAQYDRSSSNERKGSQNASGSSRSSANANQGRQNAGRSNIDPRKDAALEEVNYFQGKLSQIFGPKFPFPSHVTVKDFKALVRKWQLANHPDKFADDNAKLKAESRFKQVINLIEDYKEAQKRAGGEGWEYK